MLDFAIQHLGALEAAISVAGLLGMAVVGLGLVLWRGNTRLSVRLVAIGTTLTSALAAFSDYRFRLGDIVLARELVKIAQESHNARFLAYASHKLAETTAALGGFSAFGLMFGISVLGAIAIAIRPEWFAKNAARPAVAP